jgi:hypothetical protein
MVDRSCKSSGVQEFRSSGVQEFRSSGVQEFRSSGVQVDANQKSGLESQVLSLGFGKNHLTRRASHKGQEGGWGGTGDKRERPLRFCNS